MGIVPRAFLSLLHTLLAARDPEGGSHLPTCEVKTIRLPIAELLGVGSRQQIFQRTLAVPAEKPAVAQVIDVLAVPEVERVRVIEDKVIVNGDVKITVLYEGDLPSQPVHALTDSIPFTLFVDLPGVGPGDDVDAEVLLEFVSARQQGPREIRAAVLLELVVEADVSRIITAVTDIIGPADLRVERILVEAESLQAQEELRFQLTTRLSPDRLQRVARVLSFKGEVDVRRLEIVSGRLRVAGTVHLFVTLLGTSGQVEVVHKDFLFDESFELAGLDPVLLTRRRGRLIDARFEISDEGRTVRVVVTVGVDVQLLRERFVSLITDVSGLPGLEVEKTRVVLPGVCHRAAEQIVVRDSVSIEPPRPPARQVLDTQVEARVRETRALGDKAVVEGVALVKIVYEGATPSQPVHAVEANLPFTAILRIPGVRPGERVRAFVTVEDTSVRLSADGRQAEVSLILDVGTRCVDFLEVEVVTRVVCPEDLEPVFGGCRLVADRVHLRAGPSLGSAILATLPVNTRLTVLSQTEQWLRVRLADGREGYVFGLFVRC